MRALKLIFLTNSLSLSVGVLEDAEDDGAAASDLVSTPSDADPVGVGIPGALDCAT